MRTITLILLPLIGASQSKEFVINRYFEAIGGMEKWGKVQSCRQAMDVWQNLDYNNVKAGTNNLIENSDATHHLSIRKLPNFEFTQITSADESRTDFYQNDKQSGMVVFNSFYQNPLSKYSKRSRRLSS